MKKYIILHPFLFALFPVLSLLMHNISKVSLSESYLAIGAVLFLTIILLSLLRCFFKDSKKTAVFVSVFLILFFSFGHLSMSFRYAAVYLYGYQILLVEIVLLIICAYFVKKTRNIDNITKIFNLVGILLVVPPLSNIILYKINSPVSITLDEERRYSTDNLTQSLKSPNIYYIILDGHARGDVLKRIFQYDNSEFINFLIKKGFYVAGKSTTNYCQSIHSISSCLNLDYINFLAEKIGAESQNVLPIYNLWRRNFVFGFLKKFGYKTVAFDAQGWNVYLRKKDVDILYETPGVGSMNIFQSELLDTTPVPFILIKLFNRADLRYAFLRKRILHGFRKLEEIAKQKGPYFVFAHFLTPHQPFLFGENGEYITPKTDRYTEWYTMKDGRDRNEYVQGYRKQTIFIDTFMQSVIDKILSNSPSPPIIIIQSDHGSDANLDPESVLYTDLIEKMGILNAYYFPDQDYSDLYEDITPVNTFRIILNHFFNTDFKLLGDRNYFVPWHRPYNFIDITEQIRTKAIYEKNDR